MMKWSKACAALMAGAMCVGMMAGCGSGGTAGAAGGSATGIAASKGYEGTMTFVVSHKDEYLGALDQAAKSAADAKGIELKSVDCADDMDKQIEYVRAADAAGENVVMVVLADDMRADEIIEAAGDMKVVFVNRIPQDTSILDADHVYIGSDEDTSGTMQGEMLAEQLQAAGKTEVNYIMFQGTEGLLHTVKRSEGVLQALQDAGITTNAVVEPVDCGYDRYTAMEQMSVMLADGVDLSQVDVILANNDAMALGALEMLRQNNVDTSNLFVVGIDGTNAGLKAIADGEMSATVFQNAVGQASSGVQ
ncbi:MAG: substrate-binding domain-containing protein, partial [Eubacteriales bacterium]|nr:substrate-binding domain-containing protein [Eubacteriales bacterium]